MLRGIAPNGWPRSWNQEFRFEPRIYTSNSMVCSPASASARRTPAGEPKAPSSEVAAPDSFDRPIRAALLVALLQTPHRFRTKRQLWAYSGFAVETHDSGGSAGCEALQRNREPITVRGLNDNHNKDLKIFSKVLPSLPAPVLAPCTTSIRLGSPKGYGRRWPVSLWRERLPPSL